LHPLGASHSQRGVLTDACLSSSYEEQFDGEAVELLSIGS
jgi:hypothetical protein